MTEEKPESAWLSLTSTAVSSLASTIVSSTAAGHNDLAKASRDVEHLVVNKFQMVKLPQNVSSQSINELETRVRYLESRIPLEAMPPPSGAEPQTEAFKCKKEFDTCMTGALARGDKAICWMTFLACIGHPFTTFTK